MLAHLRACAVLSLLTLLVCAVLYPLALFLVGQGLFPGSANGSLVTDKDGKVVGSRLIAQGFKGAKWFHPRPSAAGDGYDASASGGSNLAASNPKLRERAASILGDRKDPLPVDAVTASGSGLDPHITVRNAMTQIGRVAAARGLPRERVKGLIDRHAAAPMRGLAGEPLVNVLELNLALEEERR